MYAEAEAGEVKFRTAIEEIKQSIGNNKEIINNTRNVQTWEEVEHSLKHAARDYGGHSGRSAVVRNFFARLGGSGATFSTWLHLLPGDDYSSSYRLCPHLMININA